MLRPRREARPLQRFFRQRVVASSALCAVSVLPIAGLTKLDSVGEGFLLKLHSIALTDRGEDRAVLRRAELRERVAHRAHVRPRGGVVVTVAVERVVVVIVVIVVVAVAAVLVARELGLGRRAVGLAGPLLLSG